MGDSTLVAWTAAAGLVAAAVALDAYVMRRGTPSSRRAAAWSVLWLAAGLLVIPLVAAAAGPGNAGRYATVYVIERALSLDNLFVIVVLLGAFAIPREYRDRVLTWGIVGALVTRAAAILGGVELIDRIDWLVYPLAGLLLILALRTVRASPSRSAPRAARPEMPRLLRRVLPVSAELEGSRLVIRRAGRRHATPLRYSCASWPSWVPTWPSRWTQCQPLWLSPTTHSSSGWQTRARFWDCARWWS